jgi:hypothetical protein
LLSRELGEDSSLLAMPIFPQGLKPAEFGSFAGTAKAVPFQNRCCSKPLHVQSRASSKPSPENGPRIGVFPGLKSET